MKIACALSLLYFVLGKPPRLLAAWLQGAGDAENAPPSSEIEGSELRRQRWFYAAVAVGLIGASWSVRSAVGAWLNNLLPAFVAISILSGLGLDRLRGWIRDADPQGGGARGAVLEIVCWLAVALQFVQLAYDPRDHLPSEADRAAGERMVALLRRIDGEVYMPQSGYLARKAGHRSYAHLLAIDNLRIDDIGGQWEGLEAQMREALRQRRFAAVIVSDIYALPEMGSGYESSTRAFHNKSVFWPVTGSRVRPQYVFVPKD